MQNLSKVPYVSSGTLDHFRLNPFRMLSLPTDTNLEEIRWAAERLITLSEAGISTGTSAFLPFLGVCSEVEIRQTAVRMEEPLERLVAELFWFNPTSDVYGRQLASYLESGDTSALIAYRTAAAALEQDNGLSITITERVNRANLELLLGLATLNGLETGLQPSEPQATEVKGSEPKEQALKWRKVEERLIVENPHLLFASVQLQGGQPPLWAGCISAAIAGWSGILQREDWSSFVGQQVTRLQDELLDESTEELLRHLIPSQLADLLATEIKNSVREANLEATSELVKVVGSSEIDQKIWRTALAQTKIFFQNEINQTYELLSEEGDSSLHNIRGYFKMLSNLKSKWRLADPDDLLNTSVLVDEAVLRGFRVLTDLELMDGNLTESEELLDVASDIANNSSVKVRLNDYKQKLKVSYEDLICYFCQKRPSDVQHPLILKGDIETGRDYNTIHYKIKYGFVPRCEKCGDLHESINNKAIAGLFFIYVGLFILFAISNMTFEVLWDLFRVLLFIIIIISWFGGSSMKMLGQFMGIPYYLSRSIIASTITPVGERHYDDIKESKENLRLESEGLSTSVMLSKSAYEEVMAQLRHEQ